jgi:MoxR-like ATPase
MSPDTNVHESDANWFATGHQTLLANMEKVVRGKSDVLRLALCCLFAEGHLLIEDVPGVGKTTIAKVLSTSIDATWRRIQFTPDLLPSDITGVSIWDPDARRFEFHRGAVFSHLVLGDEINRASPRPSRPCSRSWRNGRSPWTPSATRCPGRSWSSPPRTPSTSAAPTVCPRPSSTAS